jgi:hypothetical protein
MSRTFWQSGGFSAGLGRRRAVRRFGAPRSGSAGSTAGKDARRHGVPAHAVFWILKTRPGKSREPAGLKPVLRREVAERPPVRCGRSRRIKPNQGGNFENMPNNLNIEAGWHLGRVERARTPDIIKLSREMGASPHSGRRAANRHGRVARATIPIVEAGLKPSIKKSYYRNDTKTH